MVCGGKDAWKTAFMTLLGTCAHEINLSLHYRGRLRNKYRTLLALDRFNLVLYFMPQNGTNFVLRGGKTRLFHSGLSRPRPAYLGCTRNTHHEYHDVPLITMAR
jgi:hypothetical protein